ncbi:MAG: response regulator [Parerythrobacter sp.]
MTHHSGAPRETKLLPGARVLVATAAPAARGAIAAMLDRFGVAVVTKDSEEATIAALMEGRIGRSSSPPPAFGLALFAHDLPDTGGFKTAQIARALGLDPGTLPIVALAPNISDKTRDAAYNAAMQGVLVSPDGGGPNAAELQFVLERWLPTCGPSRHAAPGLKQGDGLSDRWRMRRAEALEAVAAAMREGRFTGGGAQDLARTMHKLAGTAGLFGEDALGESARRLEHALRREDGVVACEQRARDVVAAAA